MSNDSRKDMPSGLRMVMGKASKTVTSADLIKELTLYFNSVLTPIDEDLIKVYGLLLFYKENEADYPILCEMAKHVYFHYFNIVFKMYRKKISKYRRKNISNVSKYQIKISKYRNINLGISKYQSIKFKYRNIEFQFRYRYKYIEPLCIDYSSILSK